MKFVKTALAAAVAVTAATAATPSVAADAKAAIENRQDVMKIVGANFKTIACAVKGECKDDMKFLGLQALSLAKASSLSLDAFKEGPFKNAGVKTTSKADIWENKDKFDGGLKAMHKGAMDMAAAAKGGDMNAFKAAFKETGKTCKGCHDNFREK